MLKKRSFFLRNIVLIMMIAVLSIMAAGCGAADDADEMSGVDGNGKTLVYGSGDYTAINPALYEHGEINALLFAGLTAHDADNKLISGLAESWSFDEKNLTYTFNLRDGLTFHDGQPLTSEDVKFTLEAILDPKNQSEIISNYSDIEEILCPDKKTVNIRLSQENVAFPDYMTIGILPKHLLEGKELATCDFNQNPVGAGPYMMTAWDMGQSITMKKFNDYYGGTASIENIVFKIVPDTDSRALQLKTGDIDMAQITAKTAKDIESTGEFNVYRMDTADYRAIAYNFAGCELFALNPELSNIISYAIDREAIVESVLLGEGQTAYSPLQKNIYNCEGMEKFNYNPEKVRTLLEENGWKLNSNKFYEKNGRELAFSIAAMADDGVRVDMAKVCANQLRQLGMNVTAEAKQSLDWANQDCCIIGWGSPFDADDHTYKVFSSEAGDNYTGYANQNVDKILADARHTSDNSKRKALYEAFQYEISKFMPYTFIAYVDADYAVRKGITGLTENTVLGHHGVGVFHNIAEWEMK